MLDVMKDEMSEAKLAIFARINNAVVEKAEASSNPLLKETAKVLASRAFDQASAGVDMSAPGPERESVKPTLVNDFDFGDPQARRYNFPNATVSVKVGNKVVSIELTADTYRDTYRTPMTLASCTVRNDGGLKESVLAFLDKDVDFSEILESYFEKVVEKVAEKKAAEKVEHERIFDAKYQQLQAVLTSLLPILPRGMTIKHSTTKEEYLKNSWGDLGLTITYRGKDFPVSVSSKDGILRTHDLEYHDKNYKIAKSLVTKIAEWMDGYWEVQARRVAVASKVNNQAAMLTELIGRPVKGDEKNLWQFRFEVADNAYQYVTFSYTASSDATPERFGMFGVTVTREQLLTITNILIAAAAKVKK